MNISVRNIIDFLAAPAAAQENTVDKLEFGSPDTPVTGIGTTFLATQEVVETAISLGINLLISHEGIFYSHRGRREELTENKVYQTKCQTILDHDMAIYRYHDQIHRQLPDMVTAGLVHALGWQAFETVNLKEASILEIPVMSLQEVLYHVKKCLGTPYVRFTGELSMPCRRAGILVGYRGGGELTIPLSEDKSLDLLIYGEGPEWETPEYIRDAVRQGRQKALIVLGHAESEMPGMACLAQRLQTEFPGIPVHFLPNTPVFRTF